MKLKAALTLILTMCAVLALGLSVSAQDMVPTVEVSDQLSLDGMLTVSKVVATNPGFIVIHADNDGSFGPVIGYRQISVGENTNVKVPIDGAAATPTLYAMLHGDDNTVGVYEFGQVQGADAPVVVDGAPVSPSFAATIMNVTDQFVSEGAYTAPSITMQEVGWLVIHAASDSGGPGPVIGFTAVEPGTTADVVVELDAEGVTNVLWPMLHVDTGQAGVYEFGEVEGADTPVRVNGAVATTNVWTVPHVRVAPQLVTHADGMDAGGMAPTVWAGSVLSEGPGWLVIHSESEGGPGPVAGFAQVGAGLTEDITIELDPAATTPNLWPMLHVDTGVEGTYEFGEVEGADTPVRVGENVVAFQITAAPSIVYEVTDNGDGTLTVAQAISDGPGWLVIHADNNGGPGPVLGAALLSPGLNTRVVVPVTAEGMTSTVFPMLHVDNGVVGVYEFGEVDGADTPVRVGESVITGPAEVMVAQ